MNYKLEDFKKWLEENSIAESEIASDLDKLDELKAKRRRIDTILYNLVIKKENIHNLSERFSELLQRWKKENKILLAPPLPSQLSKTPGSFVEELKQNQAEGNLKPSQMKKRGSNSSISSLEIDKSFKNNEEKIKASEKRTKKLTPLLASSRSEEESDSSEENSISDLSKELSREVEDLQKQIENLKEKFATEKEELSKEIDKWKESFKLSSQLQAKFKKATEEAKQEMENLRIKARYESEYLQEQLDKTKKLLENTSVQGNAWEELQTELSQSKQQILALQTQLSAKIPTNYYWKEALIIAGMIIIAYLALE